MSAKEMFEKLEYELVFENEEVLRYRMKEELEQFNINLEDIKEDNNLFNNIQEAIDKLRMHTLADRFEVVLNNNLIETKEKLTNYRTILGCRISYDNLDKNVSFIVREDTKPSYEKLEEENIKYKQVLDKIKEYCNKQIEIAKENITNSEQWLKVEECHLSAKQDIHTEKLIKRENEKILELLEEIE